MSGEGPDSVPTSADPKSRRPTKKRALTPVSAQAAGVDALFAKPDQEIHIPSGALTKTHASRAAPPEIVTNVQGSSSGAGSGEFHVYKAARRREYERLRDMDEQVRLERDAVVFDKEKADKDRRDLERTRKNREKREKLKARKGKKGKGGESGTAEKPAPGMRAQTVSRKDDDANQEDMQTQQNGDDVKPLGTSEPLGLVIHDDD